ncbi:MAG: DNA repair protein RecO [Magnetococcales bacterium]|nr:DNA repair protein RecO [Magnetococcales bacterium]
MRIQDEALVLRRTPFRESSLVIHLLTRNNGLIGVVAKGVRSSSRRGNSRRGALAGFHTVNIETISRSPEAMGTLANVEIATARRKIPFSAKTLAGAQVLLEVAYRFSVAGDSRSDVMAKLESSLDLLDAGAEPLELLALSLGVLIHHVGYGWRGDECAGCRRDDQLLFFSVRRGQVVCQSCGQPYLKRLVPITGNILKYIQKLAWPPPFGLLSTAEQALLYRIAISSLVRACGKKLMTDQPFRSLVGSDLFTQAGYTPTDMRAS